MLNNSSQLDLMFRALADGNRRAMIDRLSKSSASIGDFSSQLGISLPATLQHIAVLEQAGLIRSSKRGRVRTVQLAPERMRAVEDWIVAHRGIWEMRFDSLGRFLERDTQ